MNFSVKKINKFRLLVYRHYRLHGRDFPWRHTRDPYKILVSEIMLQQTQTDRVVGYFERFIARFPTIHTLSSASTGEVIRLWQGLGYNRRALYLHRAAQMIVCEYGGVVPRDKKKLLALPGVGEYTAGAVSAFSWNIPAVFIETNIRTVYLEHFFPRRKNISDALVLDVVSKTLDQKKPRLWYTALMDYGAFLKKETGRGNTRSIHYVKQKPFKGSRRETRGALLRAASSAVLTKDILLSFMVQHKVSAETVYSILEVLVAEGFLRKTVRGFTLA